MLWGLDYFNLSGDKEIPSFHSALLLIASVACPYYFFAFQTMRKWNFQTEFCWECPRNYKSCYILRKRSIWAPYRALNKHFVANP